MGRASLDLHVEPDEPLVGEGDFEVARLGDNGRVGGEGLQHLLGARAAVLLVCDTCEEDVAAQRAAGGGTGGGDHHGRDAALHVEGAAAVHPPFADARGERVAVVAGETDRVQVAVEHQGAAAAGAARDRDDRRPAGPPFQAVDLEAAGGQPGAAEVGDGGLPGPAGHEVGVDGVDGDQPGQEATGVSSRRVGNGRDGRGLWGHERLPKGCVSRAVSPGRPGAAGSSPGRPLRRRTPRAWSTRGGCG